jgi:hypothetical protein
LSLTLLILFREIDNVGKFTTGCCGRAMAGCGNYRPDLAKNQAYYRGYRSYQP